MVHHRHTLHLLLILLFTLVKSTQQTVYSCNASVSCGCSKNSAVLSRVVGGETASSATWGWAVSISIANNYLCGGSIIADSWILTAAHCVNGFTASQVIVYAGSNRRWTGTQTRVASKIIVHSGYDDSTYVNDIALLKMTTPFMMTDRNISQICLPTVNSTILSAGEWPAAGTTVVAVGWGTLSEGGSLPTNLQQVTIQTVDYKASTCSDQISDWHVQLCAGVSGGGKDTCQGDSGGPLMMFSSNKQWMLIGLTSNGIGCAEAAYAGIYTRVAAYVSWISANTNGVISTSTSLKPATVSTSTIRSTTTTRSTSTTRATSTTRSTSTTRPTSTTRSTSTAKSTSTTSPKSTTRSTSTVRRS